MCRRDDKHLPPAVLFLATLLLFCACNQSEKQEFTTTTYEYALPAYFPTNLNVDDDNPTTVEGALLGRYLFYDGRLSGRVDEDSAMSCASCHRQQNAFDVGLDNQRFIDGQTFGVTGKYTVHVPMPLFNLVFNHNGYEWNGSLHPDNDNALTRRLEDMALIVMSAEDEFATDTTQVIQLLESVPDYPPMFEKAFGTPDITIERIGKAVAQFLRTITSTGSKFDRYLKGEATLSQQELYGYEVFMQEDGGDCFHCHGGAGNPLFTTNFFYNNGKDSTFDDLFDRYHVTGLSKDKGSYRAPSLRNISFTAPYMHDGRFKTIDEVLDFYSFHVLNTPYTDVLMEHAHEGGVRLTKAESDALKAFLLTLDDHDLLHNAEYQKPGDIIVDTER